MKSPSWLILGLTLSLSFAATLWAVEARALRGELRRVVGAKLEVLNKRLPGGGTVKQTIKPGTVVIIRADDADYICGKVDVRGERKKK